MLCKGRHDVGDRVWERDYFGGCKRCARSGNEVMAFNTLLKVFGVLIIIAKIIGYITKYFGLNSVDRMQQC
jgi:hypothetical protein